MRGYSTSDDHEPLFFVRGHPIGATLLLIGVFVASMLATTFLTAFGLGGILDGLAFASAAVRHGAVWQLFTYALVNPPSIGFVIDMAMLWWFGREVEGFFGRRRFLWFYGFVIVTPALLLTVLPLLGWQGNPVRAGQPGSFAVFIAFATLYPGAALLFGILAKWFAVVLVGIYTLMFLAANAWVDLLMLWTTVTLGHGFVRYEQGRLPLPQFSLRQLLNWRRRPKLRVLPNPDVPARPTRRRPVVEVEEDAVESINPLLDKIARSGLASLTAKERARLEKARAELLKKDGGTP